MIDQQRKEFALPVFAIFGIFCVFGRLFAPTGACVPTQATRVKGAQKPQIYIFSFKSF